MSSELPWPFYTEPRKITVRDLDVAYRREGSGEPVVYFHGAGLTRRWIPFYEEMAKRVDFIAPEHPGFGDTPFPDWLDGFDDLVLHYAELFDAMGLKTFHLVGHSLGGWIAAEFATFFPERLRSLQLVTPAGLKGADLHDAFRQDGDEALERLFNGHADAFPEYTDDGDPVEALVHNYKELTTRARLAWQPRYDPKLERRLGRVHVPARVLLAEDDRVLDSDVGARYADFIPGATVDVVRSTPIPTSHLPFVQAPEGLATTLVDFVEKSTKG
ncbi:hydrolase [Pseudoclavibacter endophyticus]|uniref:Alpha/beta hydrolase n=1 Tax=Pseudoclavibacter endophyticus TaxID=1778590 RepID=A0A6H9WQ42_9MICO|nr:alpha/beta hydrolase [Pseudoclavibacter endophyticus]KAB1648221.1 alpha/beta hydrolase [Pseudoclavibacter endophyticus]GGA70767.1 hydrolase [Pseudoclavibacter endophyticus]